MISSLSKNKNITVNEIKQITGEIIKQYFGEFGMTPENFIKIDLEDIYQSVLYPEFEYEVIKNMDLGSFENSKILGKAINDKKVILIEKSICPPKYSDPRYIFTLTHEFGHSILHTDIKSLFRCTERNIYSANQYELYERQANCFAEHLLMPDELVKSKFVEYFFVGRPIRYIGKGRYCISYLGTNQTYIIHSYTSFCKAYAKFIYTTFSNVSKESMGLKIHKLGLIKNETDEQFIIGERYEGSGFKRLMG